MQGLIKFLSETEVEAIKEKLGMENGDVMLIVADKTCPYDPSYAFFSNPLAATQPKSQQLANAAPCINVGARKEPRAANVGSYNGNAHDGRGESTAVNQKIWSVGATTCATPASFKGSQGSSITGFKNRSTILPSPPSLLLLLPLLSLSKVFFNLIDDRTEEMR